jgi:predicted N-acetyltransferase YhbS
VIRPATQREIPEIERVILAAFAEYRDEIPAAIFRSYMADLCRLADHCDEAEVLVADLDGRVAGTVSFYADASAEGLGWPKGWAGFRRLAVDPAMRGRGIGRLLTERCVDAARKLDAPTIALHAASFLKAACHIYEQIGFRRCPAYDLRAAEIMNLEGVGDVAVIAYKLDLAASRSR